MDYKYRGHINKGELKGGGSREFDPGMIICIEDCDIIYLRSSPDTRKIVWQWNNWNKIVTISLKYTVTHLYVMLNVVFSPSIFCLRLCDLNLMEYTLLGI